MANPKQIEERIALFTASWEAHAAETTLAGMTLDQFKAAVAPSVAMRVEIESLANQLRGAIARRSSADEMSVELMNRVVYAILGDPALGSGSALYRALGYTPKSERRSGLTRKSSTTPSQDAGTPQ
jgi:hypothetical protein